MRDLSSRSTPKGLLKQIAGPTPRASHSVGLGWAGPEELQSPGSQVVLTVLV